jgi:lysophospholipase L1-like esterase
VNHLLRSGFFVLALGAAASAWGQKTDYKFDFGPGAVENGYTQVSADAKYTDQRGFGFEDRPDMTITGGSGGGGNAMQADFLVSEQPLSFSVKEPDGNYRVTVTLGDPKAETVATIKAETRRLMIEEVRVPAGKTQTVSFIVNVRGPQIGNTGEKVMLDPREWATYWTWDDKLTLTFLGSHAAVCGVEIAKVNDATTIFLMSDSTVTDQMSGAFGTWGMNLPRWFNDKVAIANYAESGETIKAFRHEKRWDKIMSLVKPGDYIFMQFGHNDLNKSGTNAMWPPTEFSGNWTNTYSAPETDYRQGLKQYCLEAKAKGAIPVVVTPMTNVTTTGGRGAPGTGVPNSRLLEYAKNAILAAQDAGAAYIDLHTMSTEMHTALGPAKSRLAVNDGNHSNTYGGYLLSRCVVEGIKKNLPELARNLRADVGTFDPKNPQPQPEDFKIPNDPGQPGIPRFQTFGGRGARGPASGPATMPEMNRGN